MPRIPTTLVVRHVRSLGRDVDESPDERRQGSDHCGARPHPAAVHGEEERPDRHEGYQQACQNTRGTVHNHSAPNSSAGAPRWGSGCASGRPRCAVLIRWASACGTHPGRCQP